MSINMDDEKNLDNDIELKTKKHTGKTENGSLQNEKVTALSEQSSPKGSFQRERGQRRTRWASVRNAIKVTNAVKKPLKKKAPLTRQDSFLKRFSTRQHYRTESEESLDVEDEPPDVVYVHNDVTVFKPDGSPMFYWLLLVTIAVLYNLWTCIVRQAFRELQTDHKYVWITLDILSDMIYVLDIIAQLRTGYLEQGLMVLDAVKLARRYVSSVNFKMDIVSLMPLDFIQFAIGWQPLLRFPRFLKVYRSLRWLYMLETRTAYPNFVRVANLTHMLFLGCHWFAAFYFMISEAEGFHSEWSYPKPSGSHKALTRKYLASLFWSTLTLTTIGDLPAPETNWEYVFVIGSYLIGVFIFATIVGQVGNVITNRNASRLEFERLLDGAKLYMRMHNVPAPVQRRVQRWYDYVWTRGRMSGSDINSLGLLPDKLKTELAIHVNLETLRKVTIFNECQPEFLHDLVLKMKDYIFTPGDLICRRGEVAREMFIIADGVVEVISESGSILTQMGTGNFFGEIGILNLDGGINRRTADVKSVGYSELFVLSREDVLNALKDHPDAQEIIRKYAEQRLKQVLQERKKLQAQRSTSPTGESAINHLILCPPNSFFPPGKRKGSGINMNNVRRRKSEPSKYLDKIIQASKPKSKYRVGSSSDTEPSTVSVNDDFKLQPDVGRDIPNASTPRVRHHSFNSIDCSKENASVKSAHIADALTSVRSNLLNVDAAECSCIGNGDLPNSDIENCKQNNGPSNTDMKTTNEDEIKHLNIPDISSPEEKCCRCGQLEAKLCLIEKQLVSVEKLYLEGIKQLETFNGINEKYIQMLTILPECTDNDNDDLDDDGDCEADDKESTIIESTKL